MIIVTIAVVDLSLVVLSIVAIVVGILLVPAITYIIVLNRMILAIIAGAVVILLIVAGWCAWRFMKKKRPKGADEKVGHSSFFSFYLTQGSRREGGSLIFFPAFT
jgi:hypothetical protein